MAKQILIVSTLDTKSIETAYLREKIASLGLDTLLMDLSMGGSGEIDADIPAAWVAEAGGWDWQSVQSSRDRAKITGVMIKGAVSLARRILDQPGLHGIVGLGGSTGSLMASEVMQALPFGIPKLMISATAALPGLSTRYIGTGDIALFHSVVEIAGLTNLLKNVLDRSAYALYGMVQDGISSPRATDCKAVALTMLGPCEKCAAAVRRSLETAGYQVIGFSAAGIGDRAMESMICDGFFHGVIDLTPGGVGEHLFGFMRDAGPDRMESAGRFGLPQVISTGSVNHMTPSKSKYKPEYHQRRKYELDKYRTWVRMAPDELKAVAEAWAEKLNRAKGPVKLVVPMKGWSAVDCPGGATYDPVEDCIFVDALTSRLAPDIELLRVDANMEDPLFADSVVQAALAIF